MIALENIKQRSNLLSRTHPKQNGNAATGIKAKASARLNLLKSP
jgi:hypothetical protein